MAKAVKLADIAEQLGVSTVTVSKALSGKVSARLCGKKSNNWQMNLDTSSHLP